MVIVSGFKTVRLVTVAFVPMKLVEEARSENTLVEETVPTAMPLKVEVEVVAAMLPALRVPVRLRLVPVASMNRTFERLERPEFTKYEELIPAKVEVAEVAVMPFALRVPVTAKLVAVPLVTEVLPRVL